MKQTKVLMLIAIIAIACSCEKGKMAPKPGKETETIAQIQELKTRSMDDSMDDTMLSFASEKEMFDRIQELKLMNEDEMSAWYAEQYPGFQSQYDFMWQIVEELDNAASMEEVCEIQAKYQGQMLFNTNPEDEDIAPYIPSSYRGTEFVCNRNGDVLIGGAVRNYNDLTAYEQTPDYAATHPQPQTRAAKKEKISGVKVTTKDRKFWAEAYKNESTKWVEIKLAAHKKGIFGWNQYKTSYGIKLLEFYNWGEIGPFAIDIQNARPDYYVTRDMKSSQYFPFVKGLQSGKSQARFLLKAYSRGVKEENAKIFGVICVPILTRVDGIEYDENDNYGIILED